MHQKIKCAERLGQVDLIDVRLDELMHLFRFGSMGDSRQFSMSARRIARRFKRNGNDVGDRLLSVISESSRTPSPMSRPPAGKAIESASNSDLLIETLRPGVEKPSLPGELWSKIDQLILEQLQLRKLQKSGLEPARTGLFTGPPGVGKTMTAHWIAQQLKRPLYTLNLSTTTSSLFGRTGANIRDALDFAQRRSSVLLIDEFDSIAKGRNEDDIGEAKRMVTVLLQEIDQWPAHSLLLAATNHSELLDRAIWRRFDVRVSFPNATFETAKNAALSAFSDQGSEYLSNLVADIMQGQPLSEITEVVLNARKRSILFGTPVEKTIVDAIIERVGGQTRQQNHALALALVSIGYSQRQASELTGVSCDTLRRKLKDSVDVPE